eukprot:gene7267-8037_t
MSLHPAPHLIQALTPSGGQRKQLIEREEVQATFDVDEEDEDEEEEEDEEEGEIQDTGRETQLDRANENGKKDDSNLIVDTTVQEKDDACVAATLSDVAPLKKAGAANDLSPNGLTEGSEAMSGNVQGDCDATVPATVVTASGAKQSPLPGSAASGQFPSPAPKVSNFEAELRRFGLSSHDKVLEYFSCALYPKGGLLSQGRMFITQHYVAFAGWKDVRVLLPMRAIAKIEKSTTLGYIPNALRISMEDRSEYFFGSFIDRDACALMLTNLAEIERRIIEIHGVDSSTEGRGLEFGYQTARPGTASVASRFAATTLSMLLGSSSVQSDVTANLPVSTTAPVTATVADTGSSSFTNVSINNDNETEMERSRLEATKSNSTPQVSAEPCETVAIPLTAGQSDQSDALVNHIRDDSMEKSPQVNISAALSKDVPLPSSSPSRAVDSSSSSVYPSKRIDLSALTSQSAVQWLWNQDMQCPSEHLWKPCWLYSSGYGDYLNDEGALDLKFTEWSPFQGVVEEDIFSKLKFNFSREFTYAFPRTSMLMFGPKFAPIKQTHYLFIPDCEGVNTLEALEQVQPQQVVILFVTKFEGIPMADVFKVLQFWVLDVVPANSHIGHVTATQTIHLNVGIAIHYIKSTMFRSQIFSGTKEEVIALIKKYVLYAQVRSAEYKRALDQEQCQALQTDTEVVQAARQRYSVVAGSDRPSSFRISAGEIATASTNAALEATKVESKLFGVDLAWWVALACFLVVFSMSILMVHFTLRQHSHMVEQLNHQIAQLERSLSENKMVVEQMISQNRKSTEQLLGEIRRLSSLSSESTESEGVVVN